MKQLEREPTEKELQAFMAAFDTNQDGKVSFEEYMERLCGKFEVTGLSEEEAMAGFMEEIAKPPIGMVKAGLLAEEYKGKSEELEKLSEDEMRKAYTDMNLGVWATMTDDRAQQGEMLGEVLEKLETMGNSPEAAKLKEMIKEEASAAEAAP